MRVEDQPPNLPQVEDQPPNLPQVDDQPNLPQVDDQPPNLPQVDGIHDEDEDEKMAETDDTQVRNLC